MTDTSQHCPGYQTNKNLKTFMCKCASCGQEKEIFSDEMDKVHTCACGAKLDFNKCHIDGQAGGVSP
jgi:hypothetical protein